MGKEEMTKEEMEMDFKKNMAKIFADKIPETEFDEESGFISIPISAIERIREERNNRNK